MKSTTYRLISNICAFICLVLGAVCYANKKLDLAAVMLSMGTFMKVPWTWETSREQD